MLFQIPPSLPPSLPSTARTCALHPKPIWRSPNPQYDSTRRWNLRKVAKVRWGHEEEVPLLGVGPLEEKEESSLQCAHQGTAMSTQWGVHFWARKRGLIRKQIGQCLNLGLCSLQYCEKSAAQATRSMAVQYGSPNLLRPLLPPALLFPYFSASLFWRLSNMNIFFTTVLGTEHALKNVCM